MTNYRKIECSGITPYGVGGVVAAGNPGHFYFGRGGRYMNRQEYLDSIMADVHPGMRFQDLPMNERDFLNCLGFRLTVEDKIIDFTIKAERQGVDVGALFAEALAEGSA